MSNAILVEKLTKRFGKIQAVDKISFQVKQGEIFGFLGPNGAGKTTTVRCITGIIHPNSGNAWVNGKNVKEKPIKIKEEIGIVPEISNAYIDLSAWQNMMMMGELYGVPKAKRKKRTEKLLDLFGLLHRKKSLVKTFSKGMKKRLILAMGLIHEPPVLFLDEPIGGLDVQSQRLIKEQIKGLNSDGKTIFLTTHNISLASVLCDRVAILREGEIVVIGQPEKLKNMMQKTGSVEVSFETDNSELINEFQSWEVVKSVEKSGDKLRLNTEQPISVVEQLLAFSKNNHYPILSLRTLSPSLEDVFVELTNGGSL